MYLVSVASVGQVFYARRLYILGGNIFGGKKVYVPALITLVSAVQLGAGIWTGVKICIAGKFSLLQSYNLDPTATWLAATSLCDMIIVVATAYYSIKARRPEFPKTTNKILARVVMLTAETGLLCAIFAIVDLYLFATFKGTNYHLSLCIELSKIYSNSILLILNWRAHIGHRRAPNDLSHHHNITDLVFATTIPTSSMQVEFGSHETDGSVSPEPDTEEGKEKEGHLIV